LHFFLVFLSRLVQIQKNKTSWNFSSFFKRKKHRENKRDKCSNKKLFFFPISVFRTLYIYLRDFSRSFEKLIRVLKTAGWMGVFAKKKKKWNL